MAELKRATPGEKISAANYNALIDAVNLLITRVRKLESLNDTDSRGIVFDRPLPANVVGVTAPDADSNGAATASRVTYTVKLCRMDFTMSGLVPTYGRPIIGVGSSQGSIRIIPAAVGDKCWIVRRRDENGQPTDTELWICSEAIPAAICSSVSPGRLASEADDRLARQRMLSQVQAQNANSNGAPSVSGGVGA